MQKFCVIGAFQGPLGGENHEKIPCTKDVSPTMINLFLIYFSVKFTLHDSRETREEKIHHLIKFFENLALKRPRPKLFVNKNAIKSNFGNYTNKVGNFQIGWERLWEFGHWAWEFLRFGSSEAAPTTATHLSRSFAWLLPSVCPTSAIWAGKAAG